MLKEMLIEKEPPGLLKQKPTKKQHNNYYR